MKSPTLQQRQATYAGGISSRLAASQLSLNPNPLTPIGHDQRKPGYFGYQYHSLQLGEFICYRRFNDYVETTKAIISGSRSGRGVHLYCTISAWSAAGLMG